MHFRPISIQMTKTVNKTNLLHFQSVFMSSNDKKKLCSIELCGGQICFPLLLNSKIKTRTNSFAMHILSAKKFSLHPKTCTIGFGKWKTENSTEKNSDAHHFVYLIYFCCCYRSIDVLLLIVRHE